MMRIFHAGGPITRRTDNVADNNGRKGTVKPKIPVAAFDRVKKLVYFAKKELIY